MQWVDQDDLGLDLELVAFSCSLSINKETRVSHACYLTLHEMSCLCIAFWSLEATVRSYRLFLQQISACWIIKCHHSSGKKKKKKLLLLWESVNILALRWSWDSVGSAEPCPKLWSIVYLFSSASRWLMSTLKMEAVESKEFESLIL